MIARREDGRHVHAAEHRRPRVLRILEEPRPERLLLGRGRVDGPGQQAEHGIDDDQRRQLTAGEHVVADRQLEVDERADALVDAFVARADEDEVRPRRRGPRRARDGRPRRPGRAGSRGMRAGGGRRGRPRPAPGAGPCRRRRRTARRPRERWRPRPHSRRSWMRIVARPRSWIRAGMLSPSGPSNMPGKSVTTSTSSVMARRPAVAPRDVRGAGVADRRRGVAGPSPSVGPGHGAVRRGAFGRSGSAAPAVVAGRRSSDRHRPRSRRGAARRPG